MTQIRSFIEDVDGTSTVITALNFQALTGVPPEHNAIPAGTTITMVPSASSKIEYSTSPLATLDTWQTWDIGETTNTVTDVLAGRVTALRMVGAGSWEVR